LAALVKAVLATGTGTKKMQEIAGAVQEGATAYLTRQFKTLGILPVGNSSAEFAHVLESDIARWTEVARAGNIRIEP